MYDFLVVGAGMFGSVFAQQVTARGYTCLVVDKRDHIGGNCYTKEVEGIIVHEHGPHIFHTNDEYIWQYMNSFAEFNRFTNCPIAVYGNEVYNLPFNMNTFRQMWGVRTPAEAKAKIEEQRVRCSNPKNLEEKALDLVGTDIYQKLVKEYTEKQWGKKCTELSPDIITRLPLRFTYDNSYFNDRYQGIPIGGYAPIFEKMLRYSDVKLRIDFITHREELERQAKKVVYTGMVDRLFKYRYGKLPYRSLQFEHKVLDCENYQGNAVVNYTSQERQYTRIVEHKHFCGTQSKKTVITKEYPSEFTDWREPYYPVNNEESARQYSMYERDAQRDGIILGGRIGMYSYFDMDRTVAEAMKLADKLCK